MLLIQENKIIETYLCQNVDPVSDPAPAAAAALALDPPTPTPAFAFVPSPARVLDPAPASISYSRDVTAQHSLYDEPALDPPSDVPAMCPPSGVPDMYPPSVYQHCTLNLMQGSRKCVSNVQ